MILQPEFGREGNSESRSPHIFGSGLTETTATERCVRYSSSSNFRWSVSSCIFESNQTDNPLWYVNKKINHFDVSGFRNYSGWGPASLSNWYLLICPFLTFTLLKYWSFFKCTFNFIVPFNFPRDWCMIGNMIHPLHTTLSGSGVYEAIFEISAIHLLHVTSVAWCVEGTFPLNIQTSTGSWGAKRSCALVPVASAAA